jgi:hypothetical protein
MQRARILACFAIASACYTRPSLGDESDTDADTGATMGSESTLTTTDTAPTTTNAMTSVTGDTSPPTTTASSATEATTEPDSTGNTEVGPQIVLSIPSDGDLAAPLDPYFFIYFDRVVGANDAVGKISVAQDGGTPAVISPMPCPPDADPTCIAGLFPESFSDPMTGRLPANTSHTITVAADFPDPDGLVNTMDQTVGFTTFDFTSDFFDDTANISDEIGGIAYDAGAQALFIVGLPPSGGDAIVRRIPIPGGVPGAASTVASPLSMGGGPYAYGIDAIGGQLYVAMSYSGDVRRYSNLSSATLDGTEAVLGPSTGLAAPDDTLLQVQSVAVAGGNTLFARGYFLATDPGYSIFARNGGGTFSILGQLRLVRQQHHRRHRRRQRDALRRELARHLQVPRGRRHVARIDLARVRALLRRSAHRRQRSPLRRQRLRRVRVRRRERRPSARHVARRARSLAHRIARGRRHRVRLLPALPRRRDHRRAADRALIAKNNSKSSGLVRPR